MFRCIECQDTEFVYIQIADWNENDCKTTSVFAICICDIGKKIIKELSFQAIFLNKKG